jgi:hypothetical protein
MGSMETRKEIKAATSELDFTRYPRVFGTDSSHLRVRSQLSWRTATSCQIFSHPSSYVNTVAGADARQWHVRCSALSSAVELRVLAAVRDSGVYHVISPYLIG